MREHFQQKASSFDSVYDDARQRFLRPAIFRRVRLAIDEVSSRPSPRVLDVGCGSGRVGEFAIEAGASAYVGIDFSASMLELADRRLKRFGSKVHLVHGDFLEADVDSAFDVVLALGVFDYTPEPQRLARRMHDVSSGVAIASFPCWNWIKGPIRKLRYELLSDCPIFDYTERDLRVIFSKSGFSSLTFLERGWSDLVVRGDC